MFIVQENGIIKIYSGGSVSATPFLNVSALITYDGVGGERGLLSMAFHPQYASNGYFFIFYNNAAGNTELAQYHVSANANVADPASRKVMLTITKPFSNHNGCKLNFGPDGDLYFGTGDGGSGGDPNNNAQNPNSYLGKMLRINADNFLVAPYYTVPADNPFVGVANTKPEIYDWGLRNPWRWSFDRATNEMWIADVGQNAWEEVNRIPAAGTNGLNFGWRCYEGTHSYDLSQCGTIPLGAIKMPIFEYAHNSAGGYAVIGGYVYRGAEYPTLQGWYVCADEVRPNGWLIRPNGIGYDVAEQTNFPASVSSFGEAQNGTLYMSSLSGTIYKVVSNGVVAVRLISFDAVEQNGNDVLRWSVEQDPSLLRFEIERADDGLHFSNAGMVVNDAAQTDLSFTVPALSQDRYYRLKMVYNNGTAQYSAIKKLSAKQEEIMVINSGTGELELHNRVLLRSVFLLNLAGQKLKAFGEMPAGIHLLNGRGLSKGIYLLGCAKANGDLKMLKLIF